ncbi:MAG: ABC transporter ATP-binding protein [candidate division Zixibacteria bacterium]|nr:ABC transporter ATP-binding protein [candidate division Zixibacteria bacterium]
MIQMKLLRKKYITGKVEFEALKGIDLTVERNEFVSIMGPSGSGKSTLMNIMGCLDVPTTGDYLFDGINIRTLSSNALAEIRNQKVGFVFQSFNLLPYASAFENVEIPLLFAGMKGKARRERVVELLASVGLADKMANKPTEMSGGEMQRVAIARALANKPNLILADEPTGNLDSLSGGEIIKLFMRLWEEGHTIIIITHDSNIARQTKRTIRLKDGRIDDGNGNGHSAK